MLLIRIVERNRKLVIVTGAAARIVICFGFDGKVNWQAAAENKLSPHIFSLTDAALLGDRRQLLK
jgi:hypothetical protein